MMNKMIALFGFLLLTTAVFAQGIPITVTGLVADVDGNGVENVSVHIVVDSTGVDGFSYYNAVTTNADGSYSDTFMVPEQLTQGIVYVWVDDCMNDFLYGQGSWFPEGDPVVDFVYCANNCSVQVLDTLGMYLYAIPTGEAPFSYDWNTGETTEVIMPTESGLYCVTTTDNNACTAVDCFYFETNVVDTLCSVYIQVDSVNTEGLQLLAIASGQAPFTYLWGTGETTQYIEVAPVGEYCLSVIDATGCVAASCIDFGSDCYEVVDIVEANASLFAAINYAGELNYLWSTGDSTESIEPTVTGQYCVTVFYGEGCQATDCYYYQQPNQNDSCFVTFDLVQNGNWLQATGGGVAPFSYEWSNGSTASSVEIGNVNLDTLCVTVTDAVGCTAYGCYVYYEPPLNIEGFVTVNSQDSIFLNAVVDLFLLDENGATFVSSVASNGYYHFSDVAAGNYIVRAVVDGYLPTYHQSAIWWDEADVITPENSNNQFFNIDLIDVDGLLAGSGGITGTVSSSDGIRGHDDNNRNPETIEGAEIILFNDQNQPVAYTFTDDSGDYAFGNLAYGTYTVYIEIVGVEQAFYTITLGADNEMANNINFIVDIDNATITTATRELLLDEGLLTVFPNPVSSQLNLSLNTELRSNAQLELVNMMGQIVLSDLYLSSHNQKTVDVSALNAGLYLLKIRTEKGIIVQQFVKQ